MTSLPVNSVFTAVTDGCKERLERIAAIQHLLASIFAAQKALKVLAPEFKWAGLGNLLGDFGELVAIDRYGLVKALAGSDGHDAITKDGKTVQIKTNFVASQVGFRGASDLMLVIRVNPDGSWAEIFFGPYQLVREHSRYSKRDNKYMIAVTKLVKLATGLASVDQSQGAVVEIKAISQD